MPCAIWGDECEERPPTGDFREINSPRAGGWYRIVGTLRNGLANLSLQQKKSLSRWLIKQHALGVDVPVINSANLAVATAMQPLKFSHQVAAALSWFDQQRYRVDSVLTIKRGEKDDNLAALVGVTDSNDSQETVSLLNTMVRMSLLTENGHTSSAYRFGIAPTGWQRIEAISSVASASSQVFVAMWFNPATETAFNEGIAPAISQAGYMPLRIDKKEHINKVDDEIIGEIRRSRFVVIDFTCEPDKPRGGVYFEAGFAMGLGIPVIWTCQDTSIDDLHFDTRQYNHVVWSAPGDLREKLSARIGAVIGDGPLRTK